MVPCLAFFCAGALPACSDADQRRPRDLTDGSDQFPSNPDAAVDPSVGSRFTKCVEGRAISIGSSMESGGISPDLPEVLTRAQTPVPPLSGGTLLALAGGRTVVASDPDRDQVYLVDTATDSVRSILPLSRGDEPGRLAEDGNGRVYVIARRGGALVTIDVETSQVVARQAVCSAPRGVAYQKSTNQVHVVCADGQVVSLPASGGGAARRLMLDPDLRDVVVGGDGGLLISTFRKAEVLVVAADGKVTTRLRPASGPVASVARNGETENRTPSVAWRMVPFGSDARSVLLLHQTSVTDLIDTAPGGYTALKGCGAIVQPAVSVLAAGQASSGVSPGLGGLTLAIDLALSPDGRKAAIAVAGNSPAQGPTLFEENVEVLTSGAALACADEAGTPDAGPPGQVVSVAYSEAGILFAQTREPAAVWRSDSGAVVVLAPDSRDDSGHFLFHANSGGGLACASCHPEGAEDGRVWNFVCVGPRRTQSLRGGIAGTAPFHWDGSERDFGALTDDVFSGRMAGPFLSNDQRGALEAWVETIPAMPPQAGLDASAVARGAALFQSPMTGCGACHTGPRLTDNTSVDVGTGAVYQVPALHGISWRGPFMHDGCAATLADRFRLIRCGGGDRHGVVSTLTAPQILDLVAFLQSI